MKPLPILLVAVMAMAASVHSQDAPAAARIIGPIADGTPSPPAPKRVLPPFKATSTVVRRIDVVEPPPMSGLPQVTGTITQTVHLVEDPGLADPVVSAPLPALPVTDPAVQARMKAWREKFAATRMAFVSATVYDNRITFFRCYPNGEVKNEIRGWSNLDFKYFNGFGSFHFKGRDGVDRRYNLLMGIGSQSTRRTGEWMARMGWAYQPPVFPKLPDLATHGPAFVITEGDTTDGKATEVIEGMHELYRTEGARMIAAHEARIKANEQRRAFLLAHPPKPEDVTVLFWERPQPARPVMPSLTEGGDR